RQKLAIGFLGAAVRRDRPGERFLPPVLRNTNPEDERLPSRQKICRLAAVRSIGIDAVVRPGRDGEFFLPVPVKVAEHHVERAVPISNPTFKYGHDVLPGRKFYLRNLGRERRLPEGRYKVKAADERG